MSPDEFAFLAEHIHRRAGISLTDDKVYLFQTRLEPVATRHALGSIQGLIAALKREPIGSLSDDVIDAMTTNETLWFRDRTPFDVLAKDILPQLVRARGKSSTIRIWSAAASTGQECYSLAILCEEARAALGGARIEIIGTDICRTALARAAQARYTQFEVQRGLPIALLAKYFTKQGDDWELSPTIRAMVRFQRFNLLDAYASLGRFDIILCRNVLIYFDVATKQTIFAKMADQMADDGFLILGSAETVIGITDRFAIVPDWRGVYAKTQKSSTMSLPLPIAAAPTAQARAPAASNTFSSASRNT